MITFNRTEHYPHIALRDAVGALPLCWDASDPRGAIAQHDERQMGNGPWSNFNTGPASSRFTFHREDGALRYPGDPDLLPLAWAELPITGEKIYVYPHAWVAIVQSSGVFSVDRRD